METRTHHSYFQTQQNKFLAESYVVTSIKRQSILRNIEADLAASIGVFSIVVFFSINIVRLG